jgi:hypothetical protein
MEHVLYSTLCCMVPVSLLLDPVAVHRFYQPHQRKKGCIRSFITLVVVGLTPPPPPIPPFLYRGFRHPATNDPNHTCFCGEPASLCNACVPVRPKSVWPLSYQTPFTTSQHGRQGGGELVAKLVACAPIQRTNDNPPLRTK